MKTLIGLISILALLLCGQVRASAQADSKASSAPAQAAASPKDLSVDETEKLLKENKKVIVLDVRTPKEFAEGHLTGAKNIDFNAPDFQKKVEALDKGQPYLVHCAAGGRSARARDLMKKLEFKSIYHLKDGFKAWEKAGKPIEK